MARKPPSTVEGRENEMIRLAEKLAEKQLREGKASAQVITHYLKLGSTREQLERERLKHENELLRAKTSAIESQAGLEELLTKAMKAMTAYSGEDLSEDDEE